MLLPVIVQIETTDRLKPIVIETTVHPTAEAAIEYAEEVTYGARVNQRGRALVQIGSNLIDGGMAFYQQLAEFEWDASAEKLTRHTINLKALAAWNLRLLNEDDKLADAPKPLD